MRHPVRLTLLTCALVLGGCAQLVLFDQAIIGQPDYVEEPSGSPLVCDDDVVIGGTALCDETCTIEVATGDHTCGARVRLDDTRVALDVSGLRELELTATVCGSEGRALSVEAANGASVVVEGEVLEVRPAGGRLRYRDERYLVEEGCNDRTLTFQGGRLAMLESGRRVCSEALLPLDGAWDLTLGRAASGHGLQSVELCFRRPRAERREARTDAAAQGASSASEGSASEGSVSEGSASEGSVSEGSASEGSASEGSASEGSAD